MMLEHLTCLNWGLGIHLKKNNESGLEMKTDFLTTSKMALIILLSFCSRCLCEVAVSASAVIKSKCC